jgi:hypothetical protein
VFTAAIQRHLDDERYRQLQIALMLRPEQGPVIRVRVIYYWARGDEAFYRLYAYTKSEQGDLTPAQTRQLSRVVREEFI